MFTGVRDFDTCSVATRAGFEEEGFDDGAWGGMPVPANWELNGQPVRHWGDLALGQPEVGWPLAEPPQHENG